MTFASGCSGDDNSGMPVADAAPDQTRDTGAGEAASDTGPVDTGAEAAACMTDANLLALPLPDASLGNGTTVASCFACIESTCATAYAACNADCICNVNTQKLIACVGMPGMNIATCGVALAAGADSTAQTLTSCIEGSALGGPGPGCLTECGLNLNGDSGPGTDGSTDAGGSDGTTGEGSTGDAGPADATNPD